MKRAICWIFGHKWTRWEGVYQLRHPKPGQLIEVPAAALVTAAAGVYLIQDSIYCDRCRRTRKELGR